MKFLVIALCCLARVSGLLNAWHQKDLQNYQDAWKSMNQKSRVKYFLVKSTVNEDRLWGKDFRCVNAEVKEKDEASRSVVYTISFKNSQHSDMRSIEETAQAVIERGYKVPNTIRWTLGKGNTIDDRVVYTDGKTCDVVSHASMNGFELWVRKEYLAEPPSYCEFFYNLLTYGRRVYTISSPEDCETTAKKHTDWHSKHLQMYQDAWQAINQKSNVKYFLLKSTINRETVWGKDFRCVNVQVKARNEASKSVRYTASFKNRQLNTKSMEVTAQTVSEPGYSVTNTIRWTAGKGKTFNNTVVFTDGQTCDVIYCSATKGDAATYIAHIKGFELWVREELIANPPPYCEFIFSMVAHRKRVYTISSPEECKQEGYSSKGQAVAGQASAKS